MLRGLPMALPVGLNILSLSALWIALPMGAQFALQNSGTTADLRGVANVGNGTAWASGTHGTVLRTEDSGFVWQGCAVPPGAEQLDFRGIQAFDDQTAIVMSSGKGELSRVYKTTDGCKTWKLVFTNPDAEGFFDAIHAKDGKGLLIGDPVQGRFQIYASEGSSYEQWKRFGEESSFTQFRFDLSAAEGESMFAASNSTLMGDPKSNILFVSGGASGPLCSVAVWSTFQGHPAYNSYKKMLPLAKGQTAGAFSFAGRPSPSLARASFVAVGGDYKQPDGREGTAAWSKDGGLHWRAAEAPPHGYRSSLAYDAATKTWITVGPNGTDVSTDDGKNWRALRPGAGDDADADKHWNALSLPYVVGPHGRIGRLRDGALPPAR